MLQAACAASFVTATWLLFVGGIRLIAHRSGEVDHTPGMLGVAITALALGGIAAVVFVILALIVSID